jgi:hypothetical protein
MRQAIVLLGFLAGLTLCAAAAEDTTFVVRRDTLPPQYADTSTWSEFTSEQAGFRIRYPSNFKAAGSHIVHSIPVKVGDPCYFGDEERELLPELVDCDLRFRMFEGELRKAVEAFEPPRAENFVSIDSVRIERGFIDSVRIGNRKGYRIHHGAEGCGGFTYYFPVSPRATLVIERKFITLLNPIIRDYKRYQSLPGVIAPEQEEAIFQRILSTFRYLEQPEAVTDDTAQADTKVVLPKEYADTSGWNNFVLGRRVFEVKYPSNFIAAAEDNRFLHLSHSIPYKHRSPCEFDDEPDPPLHELVDFSVRLEVRAEEYVRAAIFDEPGIADDYLVGDSLDIPSDAGLRPEFADTVSIGLLRGFRLLHQFEGCGSCRYYFSISPSRTLVVERALIALLTAPIRDREENRKLPGVIIPEQEEEIFQRILSTFRYLE